MPVVGLPELSHVLNPIGLQVFREVIALFGAGGVVLIDVVEARPVVVGQEKIRKVRKRFSVAFGQCLPLFDPIGQVRQLHIQQRGMQVIQQAGEAVPPKALSFGRSL
jgi:hypothetical protein